MNKNNNFFQIIKEKINEVVKKWGVQIINVDMTINSVTRDENADNEDPALKSLTSVFKSIFSSDSSSTTTVMPSTSSGPGGATPLNSIQQLLPPELMTLFQGFKPLVIPAGGDIDKLPEEQKELLNNLKSFKQQQETTLFSPNKLLQLLTPHLNENLVKEIQTVYEFHIRMKQIKENANTDQEDNKQIFFLDLKNVPKGQAGIGFSLYSKADCIIKLSEEDLFDLLTDNLKPFTAYMNGRIEIDGDLQDVFKLKKLIKSVTAVLPKK